MNKDIILDVKDLRTSFKTQDGEVFAVNGIDFVVNKGDILGIVGESGSGKSVAMKSVLGILPESASVSAEKMLFNNIDLKNVSEKEYRKIRGSEITMVFQDPMTALNPLVKIGKQVQEVIIRHQKCSKKEAKKKTVEILDRVGIPNPIERLSQYPHEFSGGQRQRILIAMALSCNPKLLIADEATTALDVIVQAQILAMLRRLKNEYGTSIVLITHDMGVAASLCNEIMIMYKGYIVEKGKSEEIFNFPKHPYTKALLGAVPSLDLKEGERLKSIPEDFSLFEGYDKDIENKKDFRVEYDKHSESHYSMKFFG